MAVGRPHTQRRPATTGRKPSSRITIFRIVLYSRGRAHKHVNGASMDVRNESPNTMLLQSKLQLERCPLDVFRKKVPEQEHPASGSATRPNCGKRGQVLALAKTAEGGLAAVVYSSTSLKSVKTARPAVLPAFSPPFQKPCPRMTGRASVLRDIGSCTSNGDALTRKDADNEISVFLST